MTFRVGIGYDAHKLVAGRKLILGGVEVPFEKGLAGWSDADVPIPAVIDALLGAAALGDIGTYFPSDPQYKNISSLNLLHRTEKLLKENGWRTGNIDVTIVAQEPRLAPFVEEMRQHVAGTLSIDTNQVGIKAKTTDKMGFTGRGEGIAAYAIALIREKDENL